MRTNYNFGKCAPYKHFPNFKLLGPPHVIKYLDMVPHCMIYTVEIRYENYNSGNVRALYIPNFKLLGVRSVNFARNTIIHKIKHESSSFKQCRSGGQERTPQAGGP